MSGSYKGRSSSRRPRIGVFLVVIVVIAGIGVGLSYLFKSNAALNPIRSAEPGESRQPDGSKFGDGVVVDGIELGGLTRDEARTRIEEKQKTLVEEKGVTVTAPDGTVTRLMISGLPQGSYGFDTDAVLDEAYDQGGNLSTKITFTDLSSLEQQVRGMVAPYTVAPVDAAYISGSYDKTRTGIDRLSFSDEVVGRQVNPDTLWAAVKAEFDNNTFSTVQMTLEDVQPQVTKALLQADLQLLHLENIPAFKSATSTDKSNINKANEDHTFTTRIKNTLDARMTNIRLASESISGILKPGEVFDYNARTGIRDKAHGYKEAPIDINGTEDIGMGGGVCQVSSTLYNAVIRYGGKYEAGDATKGRTQDQPGLAVIERDNHSVPSGYVMEGMDATVDMSLPSGRSNKNLRFRNDFDKPVLIVLYYEKIGSYWYEHCDIYGPPLTENGSPVTYDFVGKNRKTLAYNPNTPPITRYSNHAEAGNPKLHDGGNGFTIDMYVVKTVNGQTTETKAYSDKCDPQPPYWYVKIGETLPPASPSPSPTPSATPTPSHTPTPTDEPTPTPPPSTPPASAESGG